MKTQRTPADHHKRPSHALWLYLLSQRWERFPSTPCCRNATFPFFSFSPVPWRPSISFNYRGTVKLHIDTRLPLGSFISLFLWASGLIPESFVHSLHCITRSADMLSCIMGKHRLSVILIFPLISTQVCDCCVYIQRYLFHLFTAKIRLLYWINELRNLSKSWQLKGILSF